MKSILLLLLSSIFIAQVSANNINVTNVTLTGQNTTAGVNNAANYVLVQFSVSWENSWRSSMGPANWDAAWLFFKYRVNGGDWKHAFLNNTGHTNPAGSTIDAGLLTPGTAFNSTTNPGIGAFLYRSTNGSGTFTAVNIQLRWNYGAQTVADNAAVEVQVFGIEMVYVPTGSYNIGGGGGASAFTSTTIQTNNALTAPTGSGSLGGQGGGYPTGQTAPSSAVWPNGYSPFYCMKYEITQQQYVDFLNTLTFLQQTSRVETPIAALPILNRYVMVNSNVLTIRNGIRCDASFPGSPIPVIFYCDYNGNGIGNEPGDGQCIACNFLNWSDLGAYLDWSGLRPMTELEFEKECRGTLLAVAGEFAWGNTAISTFAAISNPGQINEIGNTPGSNAAINNGATVGPIRVGAFATASSSRVQSGAGFYGIMELTGNIEERTVTIGNSQGRLFNGTHGDGSLSTTGGANVSTWPDATAAGTGFRGGAANSAIGNNVLQISERTIALTVVTARAVDTGGRGVRSAQ